MSPSSSQTVAVSLLAVACVGNSFSWSAEVEQLTKPCRVWQMCEFAVTGIPECGNPFDPDLLAVDVTVKGPSGRGLTLPAFWYQPFARDLVDKNRSDGKPGTREEEVLTPRGDPGWRLRFTPVEPGVHSYRVVVRRPDQEPVVSEGRFDVSPAAPSAKGFVRVEPRGKRFFMRDNGEPLPLLGECACWHGARGTYDYDDWFTGFASAGMNYTRLWMWPHAFGIEVRDGDRLKYNLPRAWTLDYVLQLAAERNIAVMLCLDYHGIFQVDPDMWGGNNWWPQHPYNKSTGGPCAAQSDFFTDDTAASLYRKRLRYLIGRYSAYPSLMAWQFFNEINNVYRYLKPADVVAWHDRMARWLKQADPYSHPITTSFGSKGEQAAMWNLPSLDFCQWHLYLNWAGHYRSPAPMAADVAKRFHRDYEKPVYVGEYGTSGKGWKPEIDPYRRGLQQALWGGIMTGTAGTAMPWWWESVHKENLYYLWGAISDFLQDTGFGGPQWHPVNMHTENDEVGNAVGAKTETTDLEAFAMTDGTQLLLWCIDKRYQYPDRAKDQATELAGARIRIPGLPDGTYTVTWWNTWTGQTAGTDEAASTNGHMTLDLIPFNTDIAARIQPAQDL